VCCAQEDKKFDTHEHNRMPADAPVNAGETLRTKRFRKEVTSKQ